MRVRPRVGFLAGPPAGLREEGEGDGPRGKAGAKERGERGRALGPK